MSETLNSNIPSSAEDELTLAEFKETFQLLLDAFSEFDGENVKVLRESIFSNFPLTYSSFKIQFPGLKKFLFHEVLEWPLKAEKEASILEYTDSQYRKFPEKQPAAYSLFRQIAGNSSFLFDRFDYVFCQFWAKYYEKHMEAVTYMHNDTDLTYSEDEKENLQKQHEIRELYRSAEKILLLYWVFLPFHIVKTIEEAAPLYNELSEFYRIQKNTLQNAVESSSPEAQDELAALLRRCSEHPEALPDLKKLEQLEHALSYVMHYELFYNLMAQAEAETTHIVTDLQPSSDRWHPYFHVGRNITFTSRREYAEKYNQIPQIEKFAELSASITKDCRKCNVGSCSSCACAPLASEESAQIYQELITSVLPLAPKNKTETSFDTKNSSTN